jgi:hypothetical protein
VASRNKGLSTWQQNDRVVIAYVVYIRAVIFLMFIFSPPKALYITGDPIWTQGHVETFTISLLISMDICSIQSVHMKCISFYCNITHELKGRGMKTKCP